jgi:hypothetical protein
MTTEENYHDRLKGFSPAELPLTLQHAVTTSYILGLQYLWIDSICIVQGTSDWETECPKMGSIYRGSTVTIAAEAAMDSTAGFFQSRNADDPNVPLTCELQYTGSDGASAGPVKLAYPRFRHFYEYNASEMSSVLRLRGWVLQERILSPRTLHFGARQMFWSCNAGFSTSQADLGKTKPSNQDLDKILIRAPVDERATNLKFRGQAPRIGSSRATTV